MIFCVVNQEYEKCVTKGVGWGGMGGGKTRKKQTFKITKLYAEEIPKTFLYHTE